MGAAGTTREVTATYNERCLKCRYLAPKLEPPCGRVFGARVLVGPYGGDIQIDFIPGMIPKEFEKQLEEYLGKVFQWMSAVLEKCPIWDQIGDYQKNHPEAADCPGREETQNPYLRVVKT